MTDVYISDGTASINGKLPSGSLSVISSLSGRKQWRGTLGVKFEASLGNIEILSKANLGFRFVDGDGSLKKMLARAKGVNALTAKQIAKGNTYKPAKKLMDYQERELDRGWAREAFAYLWEMGLGKSCVTCANIGRLWTADAIDAVLIIAPNGVHEQWAEEQLPEHLSKNIKVDVQVWGRKGFKIARKPGKLHIMTINIEAIRSERGSRAVGEFLNTHHNIYCTVDESHRIKTFGVQQTKAAIAIGKRCKFRRILTGTPLAKSVEDFFSQFYFLDPAIIGLQYLTAFRNRYCIMGGFEGRQVVGHKNLEDFYRKIEPHSSRLTKDEVLSLPPKHYVVHEYAMGDRTTKHYKELKRDFITMLASGEIATVTNAASGLVRLQQIVCGYLPTEDAVEEISKERIDVLLDVVEQRSGPIVIWSRFREDVRRVSEALAKKYGAKQVVTYFGGTKKSERSDNVKAFLSGKSRFFVGNAAAGGTGLNLQGKCETTIYYSNDFSALSRWQSEDRVHRIGMGKSMTYIDIVARGTMDRLILANLRRKKDLSSLTLDEIRKALA